MKKSILLLACVASSAFLLMSAIAKQSDTSSDLNAPKSGGKKVTGDFTGGGRHIGQKSQDSPIQAAGDFTGGHKDCLEPPCDEGTGKVRTASLDGAADMSALKGKPAKAQGGCLMHCVACKTGEAERPAIQWGTPEGSEAYKAAMKDKCKCSISAGCLAASVEEGKKEKPQFATAQMLPGDCVRTHRCKQYLESVPVHLSDQFVCEKEVAEVEAKTYPDKRLRWKCAKR